MTDKDLEEQLLKLMAQKDLSAQDKYNKIQALAKKYDMPLDKMMKNIIMGWMDDDKEKKINTINKKGGTGKIL